MSNMQIDSVLSQIRALSAQVKPPRATAVDAAAAAAGSASAQQASAAGSDNFAALMKQGLSTVNQMQNKAGTMATDFQRGKPGVELADVMVEMQKASVSFRTAVEVRNKMVSAYQDIMNMQV